MNNAEMRKSDTFENFVIGACAQYPVNKRFVYFCFSISFW